MKWNLEKKDIGELKEYAFNPRKLSKHDAKHLKESITKFGQCEPIVINVDGLIIGGHQRVRTLRKLGAREVDVYVPDRALDEKEVRELNIRLNRNSGEFDFDMLANAWDVGDLLDWGFLEDELQIDVEVIESSEEEEKTPEPPKDPKTKPGDVYELGDHRLICGDSCNPDDVSKLLNGEEPILMVTDPPYGVKYDASWRDRDGKAIYATGKVQNDDIADWSLAWALFPGSVAYIWHAAFFSHVVAKSLLDNDFEIKSQIIWVKQHFALSRGDYHWQHEPCWYAVRKGHANNWQGSRKEATVWEIASLNAFGKSTVEDERTEHSTQKPLEAMSRPIKNNSAKGESVYDPFLGSGTTLLACEIHGRKCLGVELDPKYCDLIVSRYMRYCKKNAQECSIKLNGQEIDWKEETQEVDG